MLLQQTGPAVWLEFDFENELAERKDGSRYSSEAAPVADFSALNHSIISPLWVRASLGARVTCGTSQVLLAGVSGGFSPGTPVFAPPTD